MEQPQNCEMKIEVLIDRLTRPIENYNGYNFCLYSKNPKIWDAFGKMKTNIGSDFEYKLLL